MLRRPLLPLLTLVGLSAACGNPAIDPNQTYTATGQVLDASGQPIQGAEVELLKYWSNSRRLEPSIERLFSEDPTRNPPASLGIEVVETVRTDMDGRYTISVLGERLAQPGGYRTGEGLVEVATSVVVVKDPNDASGRTGVATYPFEYMRAAFRWDAGALQLWDSGAEADVSSAARDGLVRLRWRKIDRAGSSVRNTYRLWVGNDAGRALVLGCSEGAAVQGGCAEDPQDPQKLVRSISAYSLRNFYSNPDGSFQAFVIARGAQYRFASRFFVQPIPDLTDTRDAIPTEGVWAVGTGPDELLTGTAALDGDPATRAEITNGATAIYVKLPLSVVTDAGVLNALVSDAAEGCLVLEFSDTVFSDIDAAKASSDGAWTAAGKFCGETGGPDEVSALAGFDTTASEGKAAGWMRVRAEADGMGAQPRFQAVGEVALFQARM